MTIKMIISLLTIMCEILNFMSPTFEFVFKIYIFFVLKITGGVRAHLAPAERTPVPYHSRPVTPHECIENKNTRKLNFVFLATFSQPLTA